MDIISTYPSVIYEVTKTNGEEINVDNPSLLPEPQEIQEIREPIVKVFIMLPGNTSGISCNLSWKTRQRGQYGDH